MYIQTQNNLLLIGIVFTLFEPTVLLGQANDWLPEQPEIREVEILNSPQRESNLCLTSDNLTFYFTSLRGGMLYNQRMGSFDGQPVFDGDIFMATRPNTHEGFGPPIRLNPPFNDQLSQDEVHISASGRVLTYQRWTYNWKSDGGPYYEVVMNSDGTWGTPRPLGGTITQFFIENDFKATDGMTRTPDGSLIFAAGPEYGAPMDLYYAHHISKGEFAPVARLGCSTSFDERSVFIAADNLTMYFASDRPGGEGGLDIYRVTINNDWTVSEPMNIGSPYNTQEDEYGMTVHSQSEAYFIRSGDIYKATKLNAPVIPTEPVVQAPSDVFKDPEELTTPGQLIKRQPLGNIEPLPKTKPSVDPPNNKLPTEIPQQYNNVVFLLDRSNSMDQEGKLPMLTNSMIGFLPGLRKNDRFSVITFADSPAAIFNGLPGGTNQELVEAKLRGLNAGGRTDGLSALELGLDMGIKNLIKGGNNVVIFATDGKMETENGRMSLEKLFPIAKKFAKNGLQLIVFSYGSPGPETRANLEKLAILGGGWYENVHPGNIDQVLSKALNNIQIGAN